MKLILVFTYFTNFPCCFLMGHGAKPFQVFVLLLSICSWLHLLYCIGLLIFFGLKKILETLKKPTILYSMLQRFFFNTLLMFRNVEVEVPYRFFFFFAKKHNSIYLNLTLFLYNCWSSNQMISISLMISLRITPHSFMILYFAFQYFIHLELILIFSMGQRSNLLFF